MAFGLHSPTHIPLRYRKVLAPKLYYYANETEQIWLDPATDTFLRELEHHSQRALTASLGQERLDNYLLSTFQRDMCTASGFDQQSSPFHFLHTALNDLDCSACAGPRPVCQGRDIESDSVNADLCGHCIGPLHSLFQASLRVSNWFYAKYAPFSLRTVHFNTVPTSEDRPHDIPVPYFVTGQTTLYEDCSTVTLTLNSEVMDRDTFLAILYVLFHECICHAFQWSVREGQPGRQSCGKDDVFGEGWMDYIAWSILCGFLQGRYPELDPERSRVPKIRRLIQVCRMFHEERCNVGASRPCKMSRVHCLGERTAEIVGSFMEDLGIPNHEEAFLHLSFAINTSGLTRKARRDFIEVMLGLQNHYYCRHASLEFPERLAAAFRRFGESRDIKALLENILPKESLGDCLFI